LRFYPLGISPAFIRTKLETIDIKDHRAVDIQVKIKCRRALREAWHNRLKHGDINCYWDHFCFLIEVCGVSILLHLLKGQFVSFVIAAEHNSYLHPTCTTSLETHTLSVGRSTRRGEHILVLTYQFTRKAPWRF